MCKHKLRKLQTIATQKRLQVEKAMKAKEKDLFKNVATSPKLLPCNPKIFMHDRAPPTDISQTYRPTRGRAPSRSAFDAKWLRAFAKLSGLPPYHRSTQGNHRNSKKRDSVGCCYMRLGSTETTSDRDNILILRRFTQENLNKRKCLLNCEMNCK